MKIFISGSKGIKDFHRLNKCLHDKVKQGDIIFTGDDSDVDLYVIEYCKRNTIKCVVSPVDWKNKDGLNLCFDGETNLLAYVNRNKRLASLCDTGIFYWDSVCKSTSDAIARFKDLNKVVEVLV